MSAATTCSLLGCRYDALAAELAAWQRMRNEAMEVAFANKARVEAIAAELAAMRKDRDNWILAGARDVGVQATRVQVLEAALREARQVIVVACGEKAPYARIAIEKIDAALAGTQSETDLCNCFIGKDNTGCPVHGDTAETASKLNDFPTPTADMNAKGFVDPRPDFKTDGECKEHLWRLDSVTLQHRCVKCNAQKIKGDDHG